MPQFKNQIISILNTIEGGASFYSFGTITPLHLGLYVEGYGEIPFPFTESTYKDLLKFTNQAPFGKGSKTITDTSIRSTQEIDAHKISFKNPQWEKSLQKIVASVKKEFAIEHKTVHASLYKLLIYKEGDFFLPHKDSEKEKGMFASLVIGLPAKHTGGELKINFEEQSKTIDFSEDIDQYKMPYTAFYTDCEHEIKKVTSGYRVCLVYNLIQTDDGQSITSPSFSKQVNELTELFQKSVSEISDKPSVILLNHQYTPANFSFSFLKRNDALQTEALLQAANNTGYYTKLGLLTCYQMGELLGDYDYDYYSYREQSASEDGEMGEIYEEELEIKHWVIDETPSLGYFSIDAEDIITNNILKEGDPIEKEEEGFTGNAGMTMEYWYHYGAVIIWPKEHHTEILKNRPVDVKLRWLSHYLNDWNVSNINYVKNIIKEFNITDFNVGRYIYQRLDYSPIIKALIHLDSETFASKPYNISLLTIIFREIRIENWIEFAKKYPSLLDEILSPVGKSESVENNLHLALFLKELSEESSKLFKEKGMVHIHQMPEYVNFDKIYKSVNRKEVNELLKSIIFLSTYNTDELWADKLLNNFTDPKSVTRNYANKVLIDALLSEEPVNSKFTIVLYHFCLNDLEERTVNKPTPPENWTRKVPSSGHHKRQWDIIKDFIESPTEKVFDYTIRQSERTEMENAISNVVIDLKCETIKKRSPYTLRITKTQKAYEKKLKEWQQDMLLLEQLKTKFTGIV